MRNVPTFGQVSKRNITPCYQCLLLLVAPFLNLLLPVEGNVNLRVFLAVNQFYWKLRPGVFGACSVLVLNKPFS